ncbi:hypothetical protein XENTR_v10023705 [Xenopus tropicalis]|nr:hypothetical protein XENTR_v10023705 [Xenopus tropicalis]
MPNLYCAPYCYIFSSSHPYCIPLGFAPLSFSHLCPASHHAVSHTLLLQSVHLSVYFLYTLHSLPRASRQLKQRFEFGSS